MSEGDVMKNQLIATVGLPYSGKTTWALGQNLPIVSPDSIRLAMYGRRFWAPGEAAVWANVWMICRSLFHASSNKIILDATNTTIKRRVEVIVQGNMPMSEEGMQWDTCFYHLDADKKTCLRRASEADDDEIIPVIARMADRFEPLTEHEAKYNG